MKQLYRIIFTVVLVGLFMSFGGGETAVAQQDGVPLIENDTKWLVRVYVVKGELFVEWEVTIFELINGSWVSAQSTTRLNCLVDNSVEIGESHINFNGKGGIQCYVPSFAEEVYNLSEGWITLPEEMPARGIYAEVDVVIADSLDAGQKMTLFESKDITYGMTIGNPINAQASQSLSLNGGYETTSDFTYPSLLTTSLGIYQQQAKFNHYQDGTLLFQEPSINTYVSTGDGWICIGCDKHGNNFVGELWYGELDPGCQKFCSG